MNGPRLTGSELADLLFRRDGGGVLLSLCREAEAEYVTESGDFLRFVPCDPETRARVRAQAEGWRLRTLWQESWDPVMGREDRSGSSEQAIPEPFFLAENEILPGSSPMRRTATATSCAPPACGITGGSPCPSAAAPPSAAPTGTACIPPGSFW